MKLSKKRYETQKPDRKSSETGESEDRKEEERAAMLFYSVATSIFCASSLKMRLCFALVESRSSTVEIA